MNGNIYISKDTALNWYVSNDSFKKELALNAYSESELFNSIEIYEKIITPNQLKLINKRLDTIRKLMTIAAVVNDNWKRTTFNTGYYIGKSDYISEEGVTKGTKFSIKSHSSIIQDVVYFRKRSDAEKAFELLKSEIIDLFN